MTKLLLFSVKKIIEKEVFKFGVDAITQKSYEDDLKFSIKDLTSCKFKSGLIIKTLEEEYEVKTKSNNDKFNEHV